MRRDGRSVPRYDKVLLVEDEARLREMLLRALAEMGFSPTPAGTAEAAQRVLEREPHGIIILDLNLPLMSGMEFLTAIRQRQADVQVIILTGFGDMDAARKAIHLDVTKTDEVEQGVRHRAARLYRFDRRKYERLLKFA